MIDEWQGFENTQLLDFKIAGLVKNFFTMKENECIMLKVKTKNQMGESK